MVTRTCANPKCGKVFETATTTVTCSPECRKAYQREYSRKRYRDVVTGQATPKNKTQERWAEAAEKQNVQFCVVCGVEIVGRRFGALYCGDVCAYNARQARIKQAAGKDASLPPKSNKPKKPKLTGKALMQA